MASFSAVLLLLFVFCEAVLGSQQDDSNLISLGSSLFPTRQPTSWHSPSGRFAFGFYQQRGGFLVGIWLVGGSGNTTTVWTANRDDPPVSSDSRLVFTHDGKLLLRTGLSDVRPIANTSGSASFAKMHDSGNFVLYNEDSVVIWESFKFPTDTILQGQNLSSGCELFSSVSQSNHSTGRFRLVMRYDGNLVAYPVNTGDTDVDAYWPSDTNGLSFQNHLFLNQTGGLLLINNTDSTTIKELFVGSSMSDNTVIYRATLHFNGNFLLYSHNFSDSKTPAIKWQAIDNMCEVKNFCGFNSYCTLNDNRPYCNCLPGFDFLDPKQRSRGCKRNFIKEKCKRGTENASFYSITDMENLKSDDPPYFQASMKEEDCRKSCLEDCDCDTALFVHNDYCNKYKLPLRYFRRDIDEQSNAFFKVGMIRRNNHNIPLPVMPTTMVMTKTKNAFLLVLALSLGFITYSCLALAFAGLFIFKFRVIKYRRLLEARTSGLIEEFTLQSYSYNELHKATNGFKEALGKGSFGAVYKGTLYRGKKIVAVKRLEKVVEEGEKEFRTEMRVIGKTHHKNLVRLLGYCAEGAKRLLVYEYMRNGSLADLLFRAERRPDWNERVRIAVDVARGILYLHEECEAPIIHCDIKPQNILMDDFWAAKISDFGLAKLLMPDQTRTFTMVRGTRGYLAPEWQKNAPISVKVDTYSYGIVLLETICCRRNIEVVHVSEPEEIVLSGWAYKCFVDGKLNKLVGDEEVDQKTLENMVKVALWCIQDEPALRPSMKSVVLMLEGITDISIPPCPTTSTL